LSRAIIVSGEKYMEKENKLWTQQEVADYLRVVPSTVKNWRDRGLIKFWQAPGSTRILYFENDIKDFIEKNTSGVKGGQQQNKTALIKREKPVVSANPKKEWRI
jgi:predicted site-specific integrase-resolvase